MNSEEFNLKSFDRLKLYAKCWKPANTPIGVIILVHGLGEHINRYNLWAKRLTNDGWAVLGFDLRGHGRSEGRRGNGNYLSHLNDIDTIFMFLFELFGNIPKVLYGHSMGGNLALGYEISRKPAIHRLIITSPWLKLASPPPYPIQLASKIMVKLMPAFRVANGLNVKYLSRDKAVCDAYRNDPLVHNQISANTFLQIQEWAAIILKNKHKVNAPLLLMHGSADKITSWKGSHQFALETSENTHLKLWDDCFHELHNELCKEEVFSYISNWLSNMPKHNLKTHVS
jgi:alpha-beta hydrolase superfamily lysophospholipase